MMGQSRSYIYFQHALGHIFQQFKFLGSYLTSSKEMLGLKNPLLVNNYRLLVVAHEVEINE